MVPFSVTTTSIVNSLLWIFILLLENQWLPRALPSEQILPVPLKEVYIMMGWPWLMCSHIHIGSTDPL